MNQVVASFIQGLELGEPLVVRNQAIYPLDCEDGNGLEFLTLCEAMERGACRVSELDEGAEVNTVRVTNQSDEPVLIIEGQELVGGYQNRVANCTALLGRGTFEVPVSCVEEGRWSGSRQLRVGEVTHTSLRSQLLFRTTNSLRRTRSYDADQGSVWEAIGQVLYSLSMSSPTHAVDDAYRRLSGLLSEYTTVAERLPKSRGLLATVNGRVVGMDVFSTREAFARMAGQLVRSYAFEAILRGNGTPAAQEDVQTFVRAVSRVHGLGVPSVHLGTDVRWEGDEFVASALVHEGRVAYLMAMRRERFSPFD